MMSVRSGRYTDDEKKMDYFEVAVNMTVPDVDVEIQIDEGVSKRVSFIDIIASSPIIQGVIERDVERSRRSSIRLTAKIANTKGLLSEVDDTMTKAGEMLGKHWVSNGKVEKNKNLLEEVGLLMAEAKRMIEA